LGYPHIWCHITCVAEKGLLNKQYRRQEKDFISLEEGTNTLSGNAGKELPLAV
jgi:hypothetical protein